MGWSRLLGLVAVTSALGASSSGCAELLDDEGAAYPPARESAIARPVPSESAYLQGGPLPSDDDLAFPTQQAYDQATRPPPGRPRSLSLGTIGDAPLAGGVMRDDPMPPRRRGRPSPVSTPLWALP